MRVQIIRAVTVNLTGHDARPTRLERGEHDIASEHFKAWLAANPEFGRVLGAPVVDLPLSPAEAPQDEPTTSVSRRRRRRREE